MQYIIVHICLKKIVHVVNLKPGLILKAAEDLKIDLKKSWMIGDSKKDIEAAHTAGCNHILLKNNQKLLDLIKEFINSSTLNSYRCCVKYVGG